MTKGNGHAPPVNDWRFELITAKNGTPKPIFANAATAFRSSPDWLSILAFDAFHQRTMIRGRAPWSKTDEDRSWSAHDDLRAAEWIQHQGIAVSLDITSQAIELVARDQTFHPVLSYLARCAWDGEHRLDEWAIRFLGVVPTDYARAVAARFLISAIARVHQPGCKADCAMILEGRQGSLKSTALKTMFYPWFTDELADLGTKDASLQIAGAWGIEMSELDSMKRGDVSRIKAFLSRTTDRFRPPYGRRVIDQPRQCVFSGTVNDNDYLRDDTGARRFWPLACGRIDIDGLIASRDQLWAEAKTRYLLDEPWWLDSDDLNVAAKIEQDDRRVVDPWQTELADFVASRTSVLPSEFLSHIGIATKDQDQLDQNRTVSCLKTLGWHKKSMRMPGVATPRYRYIPPYDNQLLGEP